MRATTAPGIYVKALAISLSNATAVVLGNSLAEDLLACPELRPVICCGTDARQEGAPSA